MKNNVLCKNNISWFFDLRMRSFAFRYLTTLALMLLALLVRLAIAPVNAGLQYVTFFPAITLAALIGGYRTGLLATLIGMSLATVIFTPPYYSFSFAVLKTSFWSNLVFLFDGCIVSFSIEAMHCYRQQYEQELKDVKESERHKQALNQELSKAVEALQNSETRLRALFDTAAISIIAINEMGIIEEFNPASESMFLYTQDEIIGQNISLLMPEPYASQHDNYLKNYLSVKQNKVPKIDRELIGKNKTGKTFPIEVLLSQAILDNRRVFIGFIKDISERKQMENANRHFEAIVQSSDDAIISKTLAGIVTSWNASAEVLFGYTAEEMIGQPLLKLSPPARKGEEHCILEHILQGKRIKHFDTVRVRKDGSLIDVSVAISPIFDKTGKVIGISKIVRDITGRKQLETELRSAKQNAEAASRSKSEFLANMSHEIRTPMNAIIGLSRLALETKLTPKQQDYLQKIQTASQALLGILNDILDLSKIEAGRLDVEQIEFNPTMMLQGVSDLFIAKAEEKGLEIFLDVAPEIPQTVIGDPLRIRQILGNLVSNAIKFTPTGEIYIRMALEEICDDELVIRLSVRDTGIGINEAMIAQLFQPFSQADASITRKFGGTGLGLTISKQLVELLGGSMTVSSELGKGSVFSFTIRCVKGQAYNWQQDSYHLKDMRVLVVDDQETSCSILKNILESWQLRVETALSAEEGLQKVHFAEQLGMPFDLLLLDWRLEGMSGLALAHELGQIKLKGKLTHQPTIIMVTAYSKEQLQEEASSTATHVDVILTKPIVPSSLLNTILHVYHYQGKNQAALIPETNPYEAARPLRNAKILLVEDNELNQQVAGEFLEKAGLRVSIANHGGEAVQWVIKTPFDAVLMDLQMPEMDGFEATRQIRELPEREGLPIIAMTAAAMQHDREACLKAGMNDHVSKPISPIELINVLLRWIKPIRQDDILPEISSTNQDAWVDLSNQLPGFNLSDIMVMLAGDQTRFIGMLNAFYQQFNLEATTINDKIAAGELSAAQKRLHTLKGSAGNLGARALHQACQALDSQLIKETYEVETLQRWHQTFEQTMSTLAALLQQQNSTLTATAATETLVQVIGELDELLANDSFISDDLLTRLKALLTKEQQQTYAELVEHIHDTDYPQARTVLGILGATTNENN